MNNDLPDLTKSSLAKHFAFMDDGKDAAAVKFAHPQETFTSIEYWDLAPPLLRYQLFAVAVARHFERIDLLGQEDTYHLKREIDISKALPTRLLQQIRILKKNKRRKNLLHIFEGWGGVDISNSANIFLGNEVFLG